MKMAERMYPPMKMARQTSCAVWWWTSLRQVRQIKPTPPAIEQMIARLDKTFWKTEVFPCNLPLCRSHLSVINTILKVTTVTVPIAMKSGWSSCAPISEMYAMVWPLSIGVIIGEPSATVQVNNMARSMASHTIPEKTGIIQYDIPNILKDYM